LGNLILVASIGASTERADTELAPPDRLLKELLNHLRGSLDAMNLWKQLSDLTNPQPVTVKHWWVRYGSIARHLLNRRSRLNYSSEADDALIDAVTLCKTVGGLLIALDTQLEGLERLALHVAAEPSGLYVQCRIETPIDLPSTFAIPGVVRDALRRQDGAGDGVIRLKGRHIEFRVPVELPIDDEASILLRAKRD
jgi:hypothetical protein